MDHVCLSTNLLKGCQKCIIMLISTRTRSPWQCHNQLHSVSKLRRNKRYKRNSTWYTQEKLQAVVRGQGAVTYMSGRGRIWLDTLEMKQKDTLFYSSLRNSTNKLKQTNKKPQQFILIFKLSHKMLGFIMRLSFVHLSMF